MNTLEMIVNITGSFFFYYIASTEQPLIRYEPIQLEVVIQYSKHVLTFPVTTQAVPNHDRTKYMIL